LFLLEQIVTLSVFVSSVNILATRLLWRRRYTWMCHWNWFTFRICCDRLVHRWNP